MTSTRENFKTDVSRTAYRDQVIRAIALATSTMIYDFEFDVIES